MAEYQLTATDSVIRTSDGACIPPDMANRDYNGSPQSPGYLQWKADGGVPDPYKAPFVVKPYDMGQDIAQRLGVQNGSN